VTVSSMLHLLGTISLKDLNWQARPYSAWLAYTQSKLANLLFTKELQRRLDAADSVVLAVTAHPGYSATNLQGHSEGRISGALLSLGNKLATDAAFGARQTLFAASQVLPGDAFIGPRFAMAGPTGLSARSPLAANARTARALWELSEQLTGTAFPH
jgi:NAD(P)-dependent dehydrogenase (short-subunit alcohol dehydrogenase family)